MSLETSVDKAVQPHQQFHQPFLKAIVRESTTGDELRLISGRAISAPVIDNINPQQHEQAARSENWLDQLLEVLPGGVVVLNGQGRVQKHNPVALEMLGKPLQNEIWAEVIQRAFAQQADNSPDIALLDGRLVHISTSPLKGEPGQIVLLNDVTETRKLQLKVSHLQRLSAMGEVAARLAHQIRTPLSSAMLYLAPLMKQDTSPELHQKFAKKLHGSITHMERLIKDMLAFSRGDMANTAPVSVDELCSSVEQQFQSQQGAERFDLQVNNSLNDAYVYGSQDALASAINNLLNNARSACEPEGEITIYAEHVIDEQHKEWVEISVEDNGAGIAPEHQAKILTPFYTTRSAGTGLGLPVVNSIVKAHRGTLWFASDYGEGSTFSIRLPFYQGQLSRTQAQQNKEQ